MGSSACPSDSQGKGFYGVPPLFLACYRAHTRSPQQPSVGPLSPFPDDKAETLRGSGTCPRSPSWNHLDLGPSDPSPGVVSISPHWPLEECGVASRNLTIALYRKLRVRDTEGHAPGGSQCVGSQHLALPAGLQVPPPTPRGRNSKLPSSGAVGATCRVRGILGKGNLQC